MLYRSTFALLFTVAAILSSSAQMPDPSRSVGEVNNSVPNAPRISTTVRGTVYSRSGQPLPNAQVALRSLENGSVIRSASSGPAGDFAINDVDAGNYEITASLGVDEVRQQIRVDGAELPITLQIATGPAPDGAGSRDTVTVSQMQVPAQARKEYQKAQKAQSKDEIGEARKHIAKALEIAPKYAEALTLSGILDLSQLKADSAIENLQSAINADPSYPIAYFVMAAALNYKQRPKEALATAERGVTLDPSAWQGHYELAKANLGLENFGMALQCARRAAALNQRFPGIQLAQANALMGLRRFSEATKLYEAVLSAQPGGPNSAAAKNGLQRANSFLEHTAER